MMVSILVSFFLSLITSPHDAGHTATRQAAHMAKYCGLPATMGVSLEEIL